MAHTQAQQAPQRRYGLMKARIGSQHVMVVDGKKVSAVIKDKDNFGDIAFDVRCFHCRGAWPTVDKMVESHDDHKVLVQNEEAHVWAWHPRLVDTKPLKGEELTRAEQRNRELLAIGLVSDETF